MKSVVSALVGLALCVTTAFGAGLPWTKFSDAAKETVAAQPATCNGHEGLRAQLEHGDTMYMYYSIVDTKRGIFAEFGNGRDQPPTTLYLVTWDEKSTDGIILLEVIPFNLQVHKAGPCPLLVPDFA